MSKILSPSDGCIGYILMENDNTFRDVQNLQVFDKNHLFYVRFDTTLQSLDVFNRNNRYYSADAIIKSLSTDEIKELILNNKFKGEAGHPIDGTINRIVTVDPKFTCHRIIKWWVDGNLIKGTVETLDDDMYGTKLTKAILQNENPSFSYRGLAMLQKKGTKSYVYRPPRAVAYDEVNLPSHKEAYGDLNKTLIAQSYDGKIDSTISRQTQQVKDLSRAVIEQEIADLVSKKSENLQVVCESFDIDPSQVFVTNNMMKVKANNETFAVTMESQLCKEVAYYWGNI